jgi:hypothetical protein
MWREEKKIWHLAMVMIGEHGARAGSVAEDRARQALDGDRAGEHLVWRDIAQAVQELVRPVSHGEHVH